ncbi:MAG: DUF423 domain-containing protein [Planctomycetes bacterium]|nr:DUF423 domain-containing protein [Planctomycetota bacterium]
MTSLTRRWIAIGAVLGAIGVALGAFGAHGLSEYLKSIGYAGDDLVRRLEIFDTAVRYQLLHALAIVLVGLALQLRVSVPWRFAAWAFLIGIALFSGLLKVLTFAGQQWNWLGAIVPLGGISMIVGWLAVAMGALRKS